MFSIDETMGLTISFLYFSFNMPAKEEIYQSQLMKGEVQHQVKYTLKQYQRVIEVRSLYLHIFKCRVVTHKIMQNIIRLSIHIYIWEIPKSFL